MPVSLGESLRDAPDFLRCSVRCLERLQFVDREKAPLSRPEPFGVDARMAHTHEADQRRPGVFAKPSHLTVPPFENRDLKPSMTALAPESTYGSGLSLSTVNLNPLSPARQLPLIQLPTHLRNVNLRNLALGVSQALREVTVVRENEHAARVEVETPHRNHPKPDLLQDGAYGGPAFGIGESREHAARLVHNSITELILNDPFSVELYLGLGVGLGSELCDHSAVDADPTFHNESFSSASRAHARLRQDLLDSDDGHLSSGLLFGKRARGKPSLGGAVLRLRELGSS